MEIKKKSTVESVTYEVSFGLEICYGETTRESFIAAICKQADENAGIIWDKIGKDRISIIPPKEGVC